MLFRKRKIKKVPYGSLREYMAKNNLSRKQVAMTLGITQQYLSYYLNGKRTFGAKTALRIHKKTGIPLEKLIQ